MTLTRRGFIGSAAASTLVGCTVGEDFSPPTMDFPDRFLGRAPGVPVQRGEDRWWTAFQDPTLNDVIDIGLQQNLDIRAAAHRVEQAEAFAVAAGWPVSGSARIAEGTLQGRDGLSNRAGFVRMEASWKLDLFGEFRREREAAGYRLDAAFADVDVARLLFIEELVSSYVDLRFYQELIRINRRVSQSREETLAATKELRRAGNTTELSVAQAQNSLDVVRAELPESKILFLRSVNRIIALLGELPPVPLPELDRTAPQPLPNTRRISEGVPADVIRNRPDIRRAERLYAEALAQAGVAEAQRYPSLNLVGNLRADFSGGLSPSLPSQFIRAGLDVPLFDAPDRTARARAARARAKELLENWREEVVTGIEEVQTSMYALEGHAEAVDASERSVVSAARVLDLARQQYIGGNQTFLQVLDAERALLNAENALAQDKRNLALDFVDLHVALGGSYGPPPPVA